MVAEENRPEQSGGGRTELVQPKLVRRHLLINADDLDRLCELLGSSDASAAVREAIDRTLLVEEGRDLGEWLAARNGLIDVYGPRPPLPESASPVNDAAISDDDSAR